MAARPPDPLGGIGYGNVFKGNKAIDDLREDIRYNRAKKDQEDKEKRSVRQKPTQTPIEGWAAKDQKEIGDLYKTLQDEAAKLKAQGIDPFSVPEFAEDAKRAADLGRSSQDAQKLYEVAIKTLETNKNQYDKDEYEQAKQAWIEYGSAGGKAGTPGGMFARSQMTPPDLPEKELKWQPAYQTMKKNVRDTVTKLWLADKNMSVETRKFAKDTLDAEWQAWQNTDEYDTQLVKKMRKMDTDDPTVADDKLKQEFVDGFTDSYKEIFKKDGKGFQINIGGGTSFAGIEARPTIHTETENDVASVRNVALALDVFEQNPGLRGEGPVYIEDIIKSSPEMEGKHSISEYTNLPSATLYQEKGQKMKERPIKMTMVLNDGTVIERTEQGQVKEIIKKGDQYYARVWLEDHKQEAIGRIEQTGKNDVETDWLGKPVEEWFKEHHKGKKDEPKEITTKDEFDKLPKGAKFYRNGVLMQKQ